MRKYFFGASMEKVWLKNYQSGVPAEIETHQYASLNQVFQETCDKFYNCPAYVNMGRVYTFAELKEKATQFSSFLQNTLKLKKGDRLAIMMPNLLQYPIVMWGALQAGMAIVNVNPLYTPRELEHQLVDSGAKAIVILANFAHTLEKVLNNTLVRHIIVTEIGDCLPPLKRGLVNFVVKYIKKMVPRFTFKHYYRYNQTLALGAKNPFREVLVSPEDIAYLQYTGGTTGVAKSAILLHANMLANLEQAYVWLKPDITESKEIIITALPLYHIFSLTANCLAFFRVGGLNVLITNPRDIKHFIRELKKYRFTAITGVNTLFNALLRNPEFKEVDFSGLKIALGGGMAVQHAVAAKWKEVTGRPLLEAYGLTEACPAVCINPLNLKEYNGSIGLPISSTDVSIQDDEGRELSFHEAGELCVKGPQVMKGYWQRPEETAAALKGGWLHTGDIATIDEEGFVRIVDRKKDMILVSGFNVYPNEVEDVIAMLPGVAEVGVVGVPREEGEIVKAFVVKKEESLTKEAIIAHCRAQLTAYKVPKDIEFRSELPKSAVGKILRRALKESQ